MSPSSKKRKQNGQSANSHMRAYRVRCGECEACLRKDCRKCDECVRKKKYGGDGTSKQACLMRKCPNLKFVPKASAPSSESSNEKKHKKSDRLRQEEAVTESETIDEQQDLTYSSRSKRQPTKSAESVSAAATTVSSISSQIPAVSSLKNSSAPAETRPKSPVCYRMPPSLIQVPTDAEDPMCEETQEASDRRSPESFSPLASKRCRLDNASSVPTHYAGMPVPFKRYGVCGVCGMDEESKNDTIVLCDGPGCGQEFHMQCCRPALMTVPEGDFFCFDCSTNGASTSLKSYLEEIEDARDALTCSNADKPILSFVDHLILKDMKDHQLHFIDPTEQCSTEEQKLDRILAAARPPLTELDGLHTNSSALIGKAVLLHCPKSNDYHTGRILQVKQVLNSGYPSNEGVVVDSECLVRFPAGRDNRKITFTHWMRLEEHSLAVASEVVWGLHTTAPEGGSGSQKEQQPQWLPSKLWLRSSRELVVSMHMLQKDADQIRFRDWRYQNEDNRMVTERSPPTWILGELLGSRSFKLLNVGTETRRSTKPPRPGAMNNSNSDQHTATKNGKRRNDDILIEHDELAVDERLLQVMTAIECAENDEQARIHAWNQIPLLYVQHHKNLSCRDESSIAPLTTSGKREWIRPSPLVQVGLDRIQILDHAAALWKKESRELGERDSHFRTKDTALSLSCALMDKSAITSDIQNLTACMRKEDS
jgi:CXXC zinc finger domain